MKKHRFYKIAIIFIGIGMVFCGCGGSGKPPVEEFIPPSPTVSSKVNIEESPADMKVGDLMWVNFDSNGSANISFANIQSDAEYRLILQSASLTGYEVFTIGDPNEAENSGISDAYVSNFQLSQSVSDDEINHIHFNHSSAQPASFKAETAKSLLVGDRDIFLTPVPGYLYRTEEVAAEVACVGYHVAVFIDDRARREIPDDLPSDLIEPLCPIFDSIFEKEISWFGEPPDINGDGVIVVFLTPALNMGYVQGMFRGVDLFSNAISSRYGNVREIVYIAVPDSEGIYGIIYDPVHTLKERLPRIFTHEMQHLMNFYHHTMTSTNEENDEQITETPDINYQEKQWLNEGLSDLVEDLVGYGQAERVNTYLDSYLTPLSPIVDGPSERGGRYLFLRYLYEQHPNPIEFLRRLVVSKSYGIENLEKAFNSSNPDFDEFKEFFLHIGITLALTGMNITSDPHFTYKPQNFNEETQQWQGVCLNCPAGSYSLKRYTYSPMRKRIVGTGQLFIDFANNGYNGYIPPALPISAPPDAEPQGALVRIR